MMDDGCRITGVLGNWVAGDWVTGLLGYWGLGYWVTGLLGYWATGLIREHFA